MQMSMFEESEKDEEGIFKRNGTAKVRKAHFVNYTIV